MKLSNRDLQTWLHALTSQPAKPDGLSQWLLGPLKDYFAFKRVILGHGEQVAGQIHLTHTLALGHEPAYLKQLATTFDLKTRGSMLWWFTHRKPFNLDPDKPPPFATAFEIQEIRRFGLGRLAAHGILNAKTNAGTYFSFSGIEQELTGWHLDALTVIAPVLNDLYLALIAAEQTGAHAALANLTRRQNDIVRLIAIGLGDKSIANTLGIAEKTVRNQLSEVYAQVGVHRRGQLMAMLR